jgi:hypothetical protein
MEETTKDMKSASWQVLCEKEEYTEGVERVWNVIEHQISAVEHSQRFSSPKSRPRSTDGDDGVFKLKDEHRQGRCVWGKPCGTQCSCYNSDRGVPVGIEECERGGIECVMK